MPDVPRRRKRPAVGGMTAPIGIADEGLRRMIQELQERVDAAAQTGGTSVAALADAAAVDLSVVEGNIRQILSMIDDLWRYVRGLRFDAVLSVATYADLAAITRPDKSLAYVRDFDYFYGRRNGAWRIMHPFYQLFAPGHPDWTNQGQQPGDIWYFLGHSIPGVEDVPSVGYMLFDPFSDGNRIWKSFTHFGLNEVVAP